MAIKPLIKEQRAGNIEQRLLFIFRICGIHIKRRVIYTSCFTFTAPLTRARTRIPLQLRGLYWFFLGNTIICSFSYISVLKLAPYFSTSKSFYATTYQISAVMVRVTLPLSYPGGVTVSALPYPYRIRKGWPWLCHINQGFFFFKL